MKTAMEIENNGVRRAMIASPLALSANGCNIVGENFIEKSDWAFR